MSPFDFVSKVGRFQRPVSVQPRTETLIGADFAITVDELLKSCSCQDFPYRECRRASHLHRLALHVPVSRQRPGAIAFVRLPFIGEAIVVEGVRGIALALRVVSDDLDAPGGAVSQVPLEAMNKKELSRQPLVCFHCPDRCGRANRAFALLAFRVLRAHEHFQALVPNAWLWRLTFQPNIMAQDGISRCH
jgi:hypothetical protein